MNGLDDRDLPQDPRDQAWTPAVGPDGRVWVWFETSDDNWIVWDEDVGYRLMGNAEFDRQYDLDVGDSADEPQPW
jgi:hypothetical protein